MKKNIKIMVVTHKNSAMPINSDLYIPTLVGKNKSQLEYKNYFSDDTGENIADKNYTYCELTALYWAWKNLDADYVGLVHYRRLLMEPDDRNEVLSSNTLESLFDTADVIVPNKRNYYIENTYSHYQHNHNIKDLIIVRQKIVETYPTYVDTFDKVMKHTKSHRFNMFVMKKELLNSYCEWLFSILFSAEKEIDFSSYDSYQIRVMGFLAERLFDVWLEYDKPLYKEVPFKFTEKQNWVEKGSKFLRNKIVAKAFS